MERITFHSRSNKKKGIQVVFRLRDGRDVQITHKSDIIADLADLRVNQERRHLVIDMSDGAYLTMLTYIKQL